MGFLNVHCPLSNKPTIFPTFHSSTAALPAILLLAIATTLPLSLAHIFQGSNLLLSGLLNNYQKNRKVIEKDHCWYPFSVHNQLTSPEKDFVLIKIVSFSIISIDIFDYRDMEKAVNALSRAANSNALINILLLGCFGALSVRSMSRQRDIEALEAEKDSLILANKAIKSTIWDWKKQLYAEAEAAEAAASKGSKAAPNSVPLSKLKAIYGEVTVPSVIIGDANRGDGKSSASKIVI